MSFTTVAYALLAGIIPSFVWLVFWLREDSLHPEPRWLIAAAFACGAAVVIAAIFAEKYAANLSLGLADASANRYILWAAIEEVFKFAVAAFIILRSRYNDEPVDAMIYMITVALGFAAVENTLFVLEPFIAGNILQGVATESMRFIGATLVHIVCSAVIGFAAGYAFYRGLLSKATALILGLAAAITLHSLFNLSIINSSPAGIVKIFAWIWASVIILLLLFEEIKAVKPKRIPVSSA